MVSGGKCLGHVDERSTSSCSTSSVDTNDALMEMLGLPSSFASDDGIMSTVEENTNDCISYGDCVVKDATAATDTHVTILEVPHKSSRYLHHPTDVAAFVIDNFLDASECEQLIHLASKLSSTGFHYVTEASHTDNEGITHIVKLQEANKHKLSVFEHAPTIDLLWKRMEHIILPHIETFMDSTNCGPPLGLNPRLRVLRYDAADNDVFEPHFDATTKVGSNMTSLLTVLIYLNDGGGVDFSGGETCYLEYHNNTCAKHIDASTKVEPTTGKVVVFEHDLFHASIPLEFGTKYVLRTDILFELNESQNDGGIDNPRGNLNKEQIEQNTAMCTTLLDVCKHIMLPEEGKMALDEVGLLDLTLEALFAPGVSAVRHMFHDVLDEQNAEQLIKAALDFRE